jgi:hypothetical protein
MAGVNPGDLFDLQQDLLSAIEEALNTIPDFFASLDGAPARSFVAPGRPAADCCPQLTVNTVVVIEDQLGATVPGRSVMTTRQNQVTLAVTLFRCAETEKPMPSQTELEAAAEQVSADGWAMWNHIFNMVRAGTFLTQCKEVKFGILSQLPPEGGCVGWYWPIEVALDGYEETLTS